MKAIRDYELSVTLVLASLGAIALGISLVDEVATNTQVLASAVVPVLVAGLGYGAVLSVAKLRTLGVAAVIVIGTTAAPVLGWLLTGANNNEPLEVVGSILFRNLVLSLAISAHLRPFRNLVVVTSGFAVLFAVASSQHEMLVYLLGLHVGVTVCWLMLRQNARANTTGVAGVHALPVLPALFVAVLTSGLVLHCSGVPLSPGEILAEWVASSGGTTDSHPNARGGVNNGEDIVRGTDQAETDGADSDLYLESHETSLYDVFNEKYGEPFKPKKTQKAVALSSNNVTGEPRKMSRNHQARKEFSIYRRRSKLTKSLADQEANAELYVQGPAPIHLRLMEYDRFDESAWHESTLQEESPVRQLQGAWMTFEQTSADYLAASVRHQIKVGSYRSRRLPLPAQVEFFRLGGVNRADFFTWVQQGTLALRDVDGWIPPGEHIVADSRTVDYSRLARLDFREQSHYALPAYRKGFGEDAVSPEVQTLLARWTQNVPRGWEQVEAVIARLRSDYRLTDMPLTPSDDLVADFLLRTHEGPDYVFATAAALLLRQLDYPTRLVSGYYVDPNKRDTRSGSTPVTKADAHFWMEVCLPGRRWVTVEPTPGYEILPPAVTWWQQIVRLMDHIVRQVREHQLVVLGVVVMGAGVYGFRRQLLDHCLWVVWRIGTRLFPTRTLSWTFWLFERRARLAGTARLPCRTPQRWYSRLLDDCQADDAGCLEQFLDLHSRNRYSAGTLGLVDQGSRQCCDAVIRHWTTRRFRHHFRVLSSPLPDSQKTPQIHRKTNDRGRSDHKTRKQTSSPAFHIAKR